MKKLIHALIAMSILVLGSSVIAMEEGAVSNETGTALFISKPDDKPTVVEPKIIGDATHGAQENARKDAIKRRTLRVRDIALTETPYAIKGAAYFKVHTNPAAIDIGDLNKKLGYAFCIEHQNEKRTYSYVTKPGSSLTDEEKPKVAPCADDHGKLFNTITNAEFAKQAKCVSFYNGKHEKIRDVLFIEFENETKRLYHTDDFKSDPSIAKENNLDSLPHDVYIVGPRTLEDIAQNMLQPAAQEKMMGHVHTVVSWVSDKEKQKSPAVQRQHALFVDRDGNVLFSVPYYAADQLLFAQEFAKLLIDPTKISDVQFDPQTRTILITDDAKKVTTVPIASLDQRAQELVNGVIDRAAINNVEFKLPCNVAQDVPKPTDKNTPTDTRSSIQKYKKVPALIAVMVAGGCIATYGWYKRQDIQKYFVERVQAFKTKFKAWRHQPA